MSLYRHPSQMTGATSEQPQRYVCHQCRQECVRAYKCWERLVGSLGTVRTINVYYCQRCVHQLAATEGIDYQQVQQQVQQSHQTDTEMNSG